MTGLTNQQMKEQKKFHFENCRYIITKFTKEDKITWPRDISVAKKLLNLYPDIKFWENSDIISFNLNCIAWFLTDEGKETLKQKYEEYLKDKKLENLDFPPQTIYNLENEKIGEDKEYTKKPKNLMELLDN